MNTEDFELTLHLQRFDEAWQEGNLETAGAMLADEAIAQEAAAELVMIDLEYRWRRQSTGSGNIDSNHGARHLEDYLAVCPAFSCLQDFSVDLIAEEFRARHRWGDEPSPEEFVERFGESPELRSSLDRVLREIQRIELKVIRSEQELHKMRFARQLEIGRQAVSEPPPFATIKSRGTAKLVIAPLELLEVSRCQMTLNYAGKDTIVIENLSSDVSFAIHPGGTIPCQQSRTAKLPVAILIAGCEIHLAIN